RAGQLDVVVAILLVDIDGGEDLAVVGDRVDVIEARLDLHAGAAGVAAADGIDLDVIVGRGAVAANKQGRAFDSDGLHRLVQRSAAAVCEVGAREVGVWWARYAW